MYIYILLLYQCSRVHPAPGRHIAYADGYIVLEFALESYNWDHGVNSIARVPEYPFLLA